MLHECVGQNMDYSYHTQTQKVLISIFEWHTVTSTSGFCFCFVLEQHHKTYSRESDGKRGIFTI